MISGLRYEISIHALRKESDRAAAIHGELELISIHALRKESDPGLSPDPL